VALVVEHASLPAFERDFHSAQVLSVLCLMRYEESAYRKAEVGLSEHEELHQALYLKSVPEHTTLYRFGLRLEEARHSVTTMTLPPRHP
jgi:hypothetical protein